MEQQAGQNAGQPGLDTAQDEANPNSGCHTQPNGVEPVKLARETEDDQVGARGKTTQKCKQTDRSSAMHCAQTWHGGTWIGRCVWEQEDRFLASKLGLVDARDYRHSQWERVNRELLSIHRDFHAFPVRHVL